MSARARILSLVALALLVCVGVPSAAFSHLFLPRQNNGTPTWFFEGRTYKDSKGQKPADPVNIVFRASYDHAPVTIDLIKNHLIDNPGSDVVLWNSMRPRNCLGFGGLLGYDQGMAFVSRSDAEKADGARRRIVVERNSSWSTSAACRHQWHMRLWSDATHAAQTLHHDQAGSFVVGSIHHDQAAVKVKCRLRGFPPKPYCWLAFEHKGTVPWEAAEKQLISKVKSHFCTYKDWLFLPGSAGKFGKSTPSNGWITLVNMGHPRPNPDRPPCPPAP
jgi:hypothetical protein